MAAFLRVHTTFVSQVFHGPKELSLEQAASLCDFFAFSDEEAEFFVALVELSRSGTTRLRHIVRSRIDSIRHRAMDLAKLLPQDRKLTEVERATFYSSWYYSGVRLLASLPEMNSAEVIADKLGLPRHLVGNVLAFLVDNGLLVPQKIGFELGPQRTHIESDSPFAKSHHRNWRQKAMSRHDLIGRDELVFTAPLTIKETDMIHIRIEIQKLIEHVSAVVKKSPPETLACLNIDWVKI